MLNTAVIFYLGSRGVSAAGNLLAVAIFTRLAGPAEYGHYVLIFAWSMIVYGFGSQWMRFAYFGVYQSHRFDEYVASLAQLLGAAVVLLAVGFLGLALSGWIDPMFLGAVFALISGMTIYEAAFEVMRTRLNARAAALSMILRTCLVVALGSLSLWLGGSATGLACAIAVANLVAAIPCLKAFAGIRLWQGSRHAMSRILIYGWPLMLSFGVMAVGQTIDRLLLAHYAGPTTLGPYGAIADFLRQGFAVVGEAITLSYVTSAKQYHNDANPHGCVQALKTAFNACLATSIFGAAFFLVFGDLLVRILLGPQFHAQASDLIGVLAVTFAFMTMRNFYFAQVIYFTHASHLELVVAIIFVTVSSALAVLLVPRYGPFGAAVSLMIAFAVTLAVFIIVGRWYFSMPVDLAGLVEIPLLAVLCVFGSRMLEHVAGFGAGVVVAELALFCLVGAVVLYRFRLLRATGEPSAPVPVLESARPAEAPLRARSGIVSRTI